LKELKAEFPWLSDVSSRTSRNVIDDLDAAFKRFFRNVKAKKKPGFPKFKKEQWNVTAACPLTGTKTQR
jgi:putative transposase